MNRFITVVIGLTIALAGQASAGSLLRYVKPTTGTAVVVGGEIGRDGSVKRGSGFTARRYGLGRYEIRFEDGYFPGGCAAMTAVPAGHVEYRPFVISVAQPNCGKFYVTLSNSGMVGVERIMDSTSPRCRSNEG